MHLVDIFIAVVYAGVFLNTQRKQWIGLYKQANPGFEGFMFAFCFLMATLYTGFVKNKSYRNGMLASMILVPIALHFMPVYWIAIVNAFFVIQMLIYLVVGRYLVRKFHMHSF